MSFALPSNGLSLLSPTRFSEVYIHDINTLNGMTSQTILPFIAPATTLSLSLSSSRSNPNGSQSSDRPGVPSSFALKAHDPGCRAVFGKDLL